MILAELTPVVVKDMYEIDSVRLKSTCDSHWVTCEVRILPKSGNGLIPTFIVYDARGF